MEIVIDPQWLFAEERLYPVTVDPQVTVSKVAEVTRFTNAFTLSEEKGILSEKALAYMAGFNKDGIEHRIYLRWKYPLLPDGYNITSASLNLHQFDYIGSATYSLHEIHDDWDKDTLALLPKKLQFRFLIAMGKSILKRFCAKHIPNTYSLMIWAI